MAAGVAVAACAGEEEEVAVAVDEDDRYVPGGVGNHEKGRTERERESIDTSNSSNGAYVYHTYGMQAGTCRQLRAFWTCGARLCADRRDKPPTFVAKEERRQGMGGDIRSLSHGLLSMAVYMKWNLIVVALGTERKPGILPKHSSSSQHGHHRRTRKVALERKKP